jgi:cation diffusion facilitator CzcD-associated flavoprotein CzcO
LPLSNTILTDTTRATDAAPADHPESLADEVFDAWLSEFGAALESADAAGFARCIVEDGYWRDLLSFTWDFRTFAGRDEIEAGMRAALVDLTPKAVRRAGDRTAPRLVKRSGNRVVEAYFDLDTEVGRSSGFARILLDEVNPAASRAVLLLTALQELHGFEEKIGRRRPSGVEHSQHFGGDNWLDKRVKDAEYSDRDPEVLIVGGGQGGLILGARLRQFGVDALIVEKHPRIGDNWRTRYHSLTLHNQTWANELPYVNFPPTWPTFLPKDKLAGFLESYAEFMELNTWTSTEFTGAQYDEGSKTWTARVTRADGSERVLTVPHLVLATGSVAGRPNWPAMPGLDEFAGEVMHSNNFTTGTEYAGKRAIVVGTGNSGHDVAQELHSYGAERVTMVQRSPTCVVSLEPSGTMVYALYSEGPPNADIDLITASLPEQVLISLYQWITKQTCGFDRELLDRLSAAGFELDFGPDSTGFHMKYLRRGGGYYINVGCSDLIADGEIGLVQARDIDRFTRTGLRMSDGTEIASDLVVLATGYENQQELIRRMLGDEIADRIGPIWGFDDEGFMRNMWKRTGQENFWIMGGALNESRLYSRPLALQIKADLEGLLPARTS